MEAAELLIPTVAEFNPFSPAFQADPYPAYHRLRREDPVHYFELPGLPGEWLLTRYADVVDVRHDDERFSARKRPFPGLEESAAMRGLPSRPPAIDPPDHTRLRTLP